ncbi:MAG: type II toxin-antitoxin system RelE/ParE family toxin [Mycobacteriales bacterium]|nr:type II toxin-antitoxin system RelE/ParE family toxin [Mycobacteriales bacterium]
MGVSRPRACCRLADNSRRVGYELQFDLARLHSARRGDFRVLYRIDDDGAGVVIVTVDHRADVYRRR